MLIIQEQKEDHTLLHLACEQMVYGVTQTQEKKLDPRMNDAQGLDNPWRNYARELDNCN